MSQRPIDPEIAAAVQLTRDLSRRRFLGRAGLGVGAAALGPSILAACSSSDSGGSDGGSSGGNGDKKLVISNWDAYIDEDADGNIDGPGTTISNFQKATGIEVTYRKDFNDNDEYFNKIYLPVLGKGKTIAADITCPTQWMAARIIGLGWTEELMLDEIPNHKNLNKAYTKLPWDPGAKHFMPWQAGIAGLAYNPKLTGKDIQSMDDFFDPKYKGQVTMLTEMRDSVGLTMMGDGKKASEANPKDIDAALDKIEKARRDGQILKFTGNEYLQGLQNGDFAICVAWSGDIFSLGEDSGIKFVVPETGGTQWFDAMVIPKGAVHKEDAEKWMNFVYDPENAARITEWVGYISPVKGVKEVLQEQGGDAAALADDPLVFPDADIQKRLQVFGTLSQQDEIDIQTRFNDITG